MPTVIVSHNATPPSSNTNHGVGGRGCVYAVARTKGEWQGIFAVLLMTAKVPKRLARVTVRPRLEFRRNGKKPDSDNFYFPISKPLGDALTKGGWLPDDDASLYFCERPEIEMGVTDMPPLVKGRTVLEIEYEEAP